MYREKTSTVPGVGDAATRRDAVARIEEKASLMVAGRNTR